MPKFILSYFSPIEKIGEGLVKAVCLIVLDSHGIVHKCCNLKSGHLVTIKRIKLNWSDPDSYSTAISEAALLKGLKHPNIVTSEQVSLDCGDIYLICEYSPLDLRHYMDPKYKGTGLPPDTVNV
ncbi:Cyclin-dependent kinase 1 [Taenia solium]|eukprot:TsM_000301100 transcript=TsM_000301100 gene=TsM_000301100